MKQALLRYQAQQAKAKPEPAPKAPQVAPEFATLRRWSDPDPGVLRTISLAPVAIKLKQSRLDARMVALLAQQTKPLID